MEPSIVFSSVWRSERRGWGWGNLTAVCSGKGTGVEVNAINRRGEKKSGGSIQSKLHVFKKRTGLEKTQLSPTRCFTDMRQLTTLTLIHICYSFQTP